MLHFATFTNDSGSENSKNNREVWKYMFISIYRHVQLPNLYTKQQSGTIAELRPRTAWASAQSDQNHCCLPDGTVDPKQPTECTKKTRWMPRLIRVITGCTYTLLVSSWGGSNIENWTFPPPNITLHASLRFATKQGSTQPAQLQRLARLSSFYT